MCNHGSLHPVMVVSAGLPAHPPPPCYHSMSAAEAGAGQRRLSILCQQLAPAAATPNADQHCQHLQRQQTARQDNSHSMFSGQVVIITGAAKGIGEAAALQFSKFKAQLLITDLDKTAVEATAERCRQAGSPKVVTVAGDITAPDAAANIAAAAQQHFGRLDVLVNNAGECMKTATGLLCSTVLHCQQVAVPGLSCSPLLPKHRFLSSWYLHHGHLHERVVPYSAVDPGSCRQQQLLHFHLLHAAAGTFTHCMYRPTTSIQSLCWSCCHRLHLGWCDSQDVRQAVAGHA